MELFDWTDALAIAGTVGVFLFFLYQELKQKKSQEKPADRSFEIEIENDFLYNLFIKLGRYEITKEQALEEFYKFYEDSEGER